MHVTFWGVRGSIPVAGTASVRHGGCTPCVSIETTDAIVVLDAGTGVRALGEHIAHDERPIVLLLSHPHWDHIQGFPYFRPLYQSDRELAIVVPGHPEWAVHLLDQIDGVRFPLSADELPARLTVVSDGGRDVFEPLGLGCTVQKVNHTGPCSAYRLSNGRSSVCYVTDNELDPPSPGPASFDDMAAFVNSTDLLIHDAQYTSADLDQKRGWGHSTVEQACRLARAGDVRRLALFHHDPERTDPELDALELRARSEWAHGLRVDVARDGMRISL